MPTAIIILGFLTSLVINILVIPGIVRVARRKKLFDKPAGRQPRGKEVPTLGGLAIFAGTMISLTLYSDVCQFPEMPYILSGSLILFFIGIKDDILIVAPWWKLSGQILAAMIVSILAGIRVDSIDLLPGPVITGQALSLVISILVVVFLINSFNLIDGIDGLAAGIGMCATGLLAWMFIQSGQEHYALLSVVLCGSLLGFFYYNVFSRKHKIMMGDTGSMMIGFISSVLVMRMISLDGPTLSGLPICAPQALALAIFIIPLADMARVVMIRLWSGRSPIKPDRLHIHYRLIDQGMNHLQAMLILMLFNAMMIICALIWQDLGESLLAMLIVAVTIIMYIIEWILFKRRSLPC